MIILQFFTIRLWNSNKKYYICKSKYKVMKLIELNIQRIFELCRLYKVKSLAVFGSILTDRFNEHSDVDMLVDFESIDPDRFDYVSNYFSFRDALERLFNRKVDLIEEKALRNKYVIANVNRTKQVIYG